MENGGSALGIIDLSGLVSPSMAVFPGDPAPRFRRLKRIGSDGFNLSGVDIGVHGGTHVDAHLHVVEGGASVDGVELDRLWGRARLARLKGPPTDREIPLPEALDCGLDLAAIRAGIGIVVVDTGLSLLGDAAGAAAVFPHPSLELLDALLEAGIRSYMTDAPSVDPVDSESLPRHRRLLGGGVPIVENLRNLSAISLNGPFTIVALPIKLDQLEAAPCRAAAWVD
jgi:kynurenine formamidase